jgi:hypothetical protein
MKKLNVGEFRYCVYGIYEVVKKYDENKFKILWHTKQDNDEYQDRQYRYGTDKTLIVYNNIIGSHDIMRLVKAKKDMPGFVK